MFFLLRPTELSIILGNRSAVLYHLELFELSLSDIEEAVRGGYPKELMYKLEERRARCLLALKRHSMAIEAFRRSLKALDEAKITAEKKQKVEYDVRVMLAVMEKGNELNNKNKNTITQTNGTASTHTSPQLPQLSSPQNPEYPAFSDAVEIKESDASVGRHAVAKREVLPGEVLAVEKSHSAVLLPEFRYHD